MTYYSQEIRNIGKIITMGSLNLSLTLRLEKSEIQSLNINLRRLKTLNDLSFIIDNEFLWDRIELSSKNELLNTLFHMNKIKRIKNIVAYLVYDKLQFNEEQIKFQRLLDCILLANGVVIYPYDICKCKMNISFRIVYKNFVRKIMLYGEEDYDEEEINLDNQNEFDYNDSVLNNMNNSTSKNNISYIEENKTNNYYSNISKIKSEKNKENEEEHSTHEEEEEDSENEESDNIGLFERIPENEVNFRDFKYIYIHFRDYILGGEFSELFKLEEIYNFLRRIKKNTNIKIIFNFTEGVKNCGKYFCKFLKIADIHIFRKKTELLEILIKRSEIDKKIRQRKNKKIIELLQLRNSELSKKLKKINLNRNESHYSSRSNQKLNQLNKSSGEKIDYNYYQRKLEYNKSKSLKNIILTKSLNLTFDKQSLIDKKNMFNYIHKILFSPESNILQTYYTDKLGIYLEDFKKIYINDYKKAKLKPVLTEYDFNIYPKSNVHNLKSIEKLRDILYSNYSMFSYIIYGCVLSTILDDIINGKESYYLFYFYIRISILRILSLIKTGMPIPTNKAFYIIELKKNELNKIISDENTKKKENGFNMNYLHRIYKIKEKPKRKENSPIQLFDKLGTQNIGNMDSTLNKEMLFDNKPILYETKFGTLNIDNNTVTNQRFMGFARERNLDRGLWTKKQGKKKSFTITRGIPNYAVYLSKKDRKRLIKLNKLPPIKSQKKTKLIDNLMSTKLEKLREIKKTEEEKMDTSKYIEIVLQPTPKD